MRYQRVREELAQALIEIEQADAHQPPEYGVRYGAVLAAMYAAWKCGFPVGIAIDPKEPDWPVVYIELPTGQVSWHMPRHIREWDGHDTAEKYNRVGRWLARDE